MSISILVSDPDGSFRIIETPGKLDDLQGLVGGYLEAVTLENFHIYLNEEGKMQGLPPNGESSLMLEHYLPGFTAHDTLVGPVLWLASTDSGDSASCPIEIINRFADSSLSRFTGSSSLVVMCRNDDIWVYDSPARAIAQITNLVETARADADHGTIEVYPSVSRPRWVELRVELMDQVRITVNDEREDRTYG